ncbi:MAG: lipid-binding SYLF domain-containing protein [Planctomycetota bacterium]|jgi:lipid-binding SYLF domain-containing protein
MKKTAALFLLLALSVVLIGCSPGNKLTNDEKRQAIDTMAAETLQRLYTERPSTIEQVKKAAGYAAFSNANINIIFASAGGGYGVVIDNATGDKTYMKMGSGGLGIGLGAKDYRQILVFKTADSMNKFILSGWAFGGHADAAAKAGDKGGEASGEGVIGDVKVYAMTESGLALQATVTGTKYWKDDELN